MKKHLLSMYGDFCKNKKMIDLGKTTYETSTVETTDADEFWSIGVTYETRSQENSDLDEFSFLGPTYATKSAENSDTDEFFLQGPTNLTFTNENTDEDEFLPDILSVSNNIDFDEILLI